MQDCREPEFALTDGFVTTVGRAIVPGRVAKPAESQVESSGTNVQAGGQAQLTNRETAILRACVQGATSKELQAAAGYTGRTGSFEQRLGRVLDEGLLEMTVPDKPRSPVQKYRLTDKGRAGIAPTGIGQTAADS